MSPSRGTLRRLARRAGGDLMRRFGLVPEGTPDGLGQDKALQDVGLDQPVMVFFPDTRTNLYQLRHWYAPLRVLDRTHPVVIVVQDSRVARDVRADMALPIVTVGRSATLDGLLARGAVKLVLYVSHLPRNFLALRHTSVVHVYLGHGESDKEVSASNQIKAYDYCFVAGQAAIDRISRSTILYDAGHRLVPVGRPQLDAATEPAPAAPDSSRPTVLYAPTWEGAQPSVAYGSVASHGRALVEALLRSGQFRVIYRPHPRTGANEADYARADAAIRRRVADVAAEESGGHYVDATAGTHTPLPYADLLVTDVSAVALDWLPTGKPLIVTEPAPTSRVSATRLLEVVPRLAVTDLERSVEIVQAQIEQDPARERRRGLIEYYFGDTTPGAATRRFVEACSAAITRRDQEVALMGIRAEEAR